MTVLQILCRKSINIDGFAALKVRSDVADKFSVNFVGIRQR